MQLKIVRSLALTPPEDIRQFIVHQVKRFIVEVYLKQQLLADRFQTSLKARTSRIQFLNIF